MPRIGVFHINEPLAQRLREISDNRQATPKYSLGHNVGKSIYPAEQLNAFQIQAHIRSELLKDFTKPR